MTPPGASAAAVLEPAPDAAPRRREDAVPAMFAAALQKAAAQELSLIELLSTIEALTNARQMPLVLELYKSWIAHNPAHPALHVVHFNHGVLLSGAGDLAGAKDAFLAAIDRNKDFLPPHINLGRVLERMGAVDQAIARWYHVVNALVPVDGNAITYKTTALKLIGKVLETARLDENAEDALRLSLETYPHQREPLQHWIWLRQGQCKWPVLVPWAGLTRETLMQGFYPLSLAAYADDPLFQLGTAYHHSKTDVGRPAIFPAGGWPAAEGAGRRRLRIGYVSSDLRGHAVGYLTAEIYALHDREKVEIFAYYCGIKPEDATKARIRNTVDHWIEISDLDDRQAARRIIEDGIDILVDLNGYSKDGRTNLFALRPAPVIVNWLGYPGTMGSPYHHYIVADDHIIPPGHEIYYTEKVLRLPCYQPNDRQRVVAEDRPSRSEAGLPEAAMVYCCFNGTQKITGVVFECWMTILSRVPESVLWLLAATEETQERLRQRAAQRGIAPERLVFAGRKPNPEHMARFALADVLLDTWPYGAHTTASDALWMGVPVLTVSGRGFASRVCGSLVHAAGLGELVCDGFDQYVDRAVALGRDKARLRGYRERLIANRDRCTLFDTPGLVRKLEALYAEMWDDYRRGALPVPDLTNLDLYHEIGCEAETEAMGLLPLAEYHRRYRLALAYRDRFSPLPADGRLWPGAG
jgi:predicted O-linked N-acetylglucosamine transferase (SPINDLY family)